MTQVITQTEISGKSIDPHLFNTYKSLLVNEYTNTKKFSNLESYYDACIKFNIDKMDHTNIVEFFLMTKEELEKIVEKSVEGTPAAGYRRIIVIKDVVLIEGTKAEVSIRAYILMNSGNPKKTKIRERRKYGF